MHVVTDGRRFSEPLSVEQAVQRAGSWWMAREVVRALPDDSTVQLFLDWMTRHHLGRKRLLDTMLAATYFSAGTRSIITTNARDYHIYGCFEVLSP